MSNINIEELTNEFYIFQELYEREEDPRIKDVLIKRLLEIAKTVGNEVIKGKMV